MQQAIFGELVDELTHPVSEHQSLKERVKELVESGGDERKIHKLKLKKLELKESMNQLIEKHHPGESGKINPHLYVMTTSELHKMLKKERRQLRRIMDRPRPEYNIARNIEAFIVEIQNEIDRRIPADPQLELVADTKLEEHSNVTQLRPVSQAA